MDLMRAILVLLLASASCFGQATSRIVVTQIVTAAMSPHATNWNKIPTNALSVTTTFTNSIGTVSNVPGMTQFVATARAPDGTLPFALEASIYHTFGNLFALRNFGTNAMTFSASGLLDIKGTEKGEIVGTSPNGLSSFDLLVTDTDASFQLANLVQFAPFLGDGIQPHGLDTAVYHTTGNLFGIWNFGTNILNIDYRASIIPAFANRSDLGSAALPWRTNYVTAISLGGDVRTSWPSGASIADVMTASNNVVALHGPQIAGNSNAIANLQAITNALGTFAFRSAIGLQELTNVVAATPSDGNVLAWNDAMKKWTNVVNTGSGTSPTEVTNIAGLIFSNRVANLETNDSHIADRVADARTTDWLLSRSQGLTNRIAGKQTTVIESNVLEFVCSLVWARGMLFGATVTDPSYIIKWPNPDDLSVYSYTNTGRDEAWDMIYSASKDRLYVVTGFNENDGTNIHLVECNLDTLAITNVIAITNSPDFAESFVPSICTDETNIWMSAITRTGGAAGDAALLQWRMSDWTRISAITLTNRESAAGCRYHPPYVYVFGKIEVGAPPAWVAKISPTNLSGWSSTDLGADATAQIEPDAAFVGDYGYFGNEALVGGIYQVHLPTMTPVLLDMGITNFCFAVKYDGKLIWSGWKTAPATLVSFDPVTREVLHYPMSAGATIPESENNINEIETDGQRLFVHYFPLFDNGDGGYVPSKIGRMTVPRPNDFRGVLDTNGVLTAYYVTNGVFFVNGKIKSGTNGFGFPDGTTQITAATATGTTNANSFFQFTGALGAFPGSDLNNYNPSGWATKDVVLMFPSADINITGVNANSYQGRFVLWINGSTEFSLSFLIENAGSDDTNRISGSGVYVLRPGEFAFLFYNFVSARWHITGIIPNSGVTPGTYTSVSVDARGLVTNASNPSVSSSSTPTGGIIMFSGALTNFDSSGLGLGSLTNWALCNGTNGTPDLQDKFVKGWSTGVDPGGTGGSSSYTPAGTISVPTIVWPTAVPVFSGTPFSGVINHVHVASVLDSGHTHTAITDGGATVANGAGNALATVTTSGATGTYTVPNNTTGITVTNAAPASGVSSITPAGTIAWPSTFPTNSTPTFSGTPATVEPDYVKLCYIMKL